MIMRTLQYILILPYEFMSQKRLKLQLMQTHSQELTTTWNTNWVNFLAQNFPSQNCSGVYL